MTESQMTICPHCDASFQVAAEQLRQAGGRVRCGNCLQIFDGISGEIEFVAPLLPSDEVAHPIAGINVKPMAQADLPVEGVRRPWAGLLLVALLIALAGQLYWQPGRADPAAGALELGRLVVRPHPEFSGALRLDGVLHNRADQAQAFPGLVLAFTNRHGEPRAQRLFLPQEYLHGDQLPAEMPAKSEVQLSLSLADPGRDAVNFVASLRSVMPSAN